MKKIYLLFAVVAVLLFASCDGLSFSDGTITVSVSNISSIPDFDPGVSGIYFESYIGNDFIAGTKVLGFSGSDTSVPVGYPAHVFDGGDIVDVDVLVDIDGDDNLNTGDVYWLINYMRVTVDGDSIINVDNSDFELMN
ncbi:hypothetical protein HNR50_004309 [Spirochaeta isovalerica]|uniref:Lipoprotein n=2 Tax=Spirochaeta isovalerica TaxID=150 RepID=A0A841RJC6_9SPIO|nr:hypothetical protein [Spirochaeta isovalerica]